MAKNFKRSFSFFSEIESESTKRHQIESAIYKINSKMSDEEFYRTYRPQEIIKSFGVSEVSVQISIPEYSKDDKEQNLKEFLIMLKDIVEDYENQTGEKISEMVFSRNNNGNYFSFNSK